MRPLAFAITVGVMLAGCTGNPTTTITTFRPLDPTGIPASDRGQQRTIAIFLDGTGDDQLQRSNLAQLYQLTVNRNRQDLLTFYTEGVGTRSARLGGLGLGMGIGRDVREAYEFLAANYRSGDRVYLFGWSRGAYAARILAGMVHAAGLPANDGMPNGHRLRLLIRDLYYANRVDRGEVYQGGSQRWHEARMARRLADIDEVYARWGIGRRSGDDVRFAVMGLWDTVEALGAPDYEQDVHDANRRYLDQLCNIDRAYHALALDDNRARIYTPILLTGGHLVRECPEVDIDAVVEEVWFSGSHADVGGGNRDGYLPGLSMNWMISRIAREGAAADGDAPPPLLPPDAGAYAAPFDPIHDAEDSSPFFSGLFKREWRQPRLYMGGMSYNDGRPKVHSSVETRLRWILSVETAAGHPCAEGDPGNLLCMSELIEAPFYQSLLPGCLTLETGVGYELDPACVDIVYDHPPGSGH
ncbi:MAG: T6SS phospholipase effector Tle1-like catalytic domain-containing protein [Parasphingopyxis sp.]|uniref:T6SS phospholipase effector Tle1-like catalytic domain-containing protein n=1 Tax=Parasphingopyxis sp. TaxID=1920299 RepID=UPI003FA18154